MEVSQIRFALFVASSIISGFIIGLIYDVLYIPWYGNNRKIADRLSQIELPLIGKITNRETQKHQYFKKILLFLYDFIFSVGVGAFTSVLIYRFNDGQLRLGVLLLLPVGYAIYRASFRKLVGVLLETSIFFVKIILRYIIYFTLEPLKNLLVNLYRLARGKIGKIRCRCFEKRIKKYSDFKKAEILNKASGFGSIGDV